MITTMSRNRRQIFNLIRISPVKIKNYWPKSSGRKKMKFSTMPPSSVGSGTPTRKNNRMTTTAKKAYPVKLLLLTDAQNWHPVEELRLRISLGDQSIIVLRRGPSMGRSNRYARH